MTANGTGTGSPEQGPTYEGVHQAAAAFEALITPQEEEKPEEAPAETDEVEATSEVEGDAPETDAEAEDASEEEEGQVEATDEQEEEETPATEAPIFTVKVDGKEITVTEDELKLGYSRTADYTRKTQQLAEQRKQFESELEMARAERAEYGQLIPKLRAALETGLGPEPNWAELRQQDPARAAVLWQQREDTRRQLEGVRAEEARVQAALAADEAAAAEQRGIMERNALLDKFPRWRDPDFRSRATDEIRKSMADVGFSEEESVIGDHRSLILAWKAAQYDKMQAAKEKVKGKVSAAPVVKPGSTPKANSAVDKARKQFGRTGNVKDAAKLFENLI